MGHCDAMSVIILKMFRRWQLEVDCREIMGTTKHCEDSASASAETSAEPNGRTTDGVPSGRKAPKGKASTFGPFFAYAYNSTRVRPLDGKLKIWAHFSTNLILVKQGLSLVNEI